MIRLYIFLILLGISNALRASIHDPLSAFFPKLDAALTINLSLVNPNCWQEGSIYAEASGGTAPYTYSWSVNGTVIVDNSPYLDGLFPGQYGVTVTDANGASASKNVVLVGNYNPLQVLSSGHAQLCSNTASGSVSITVLNGSGAFQYAWSNNTTSSVGTLNNLMPGTYKVTVTDLVSGCTGTGMGVVLPATPIIITGTTKNVSTYGNNDGNVNITVCGGAPAYTYTWNNGSSMQDLNGLPAGTYTVTVSDANGCTATSSYNINQPGPNTNFSINTNVQAASCGTACNGSITVDAQGSGLSYIWSGPNGYTSTLQNLSNLCPGKYTLVVTDAVGASAIFTSTVGGGSASIPIDLQSSNPGYCNSDSTGNPANCEKVCPNTTVTYRANIPQLICGGTPQFSWIVSGAQSYSISPDGLECNVVWGGPGAGSVSVSGSNQVFCYPLNTKCVDIIETPKAAFSSSPNANNQTIQICKSQTVWFKNQSASADIYEWQFGDDLSSSAETNPSHVFRSAGTFVVKLIAKSLCLCSDTAFIVVSVTDGDSPLLDCTSTLCPGEKVTYTTSSNCGSYAWQVSANGTITGGGQSVDPFVEVLWNSGSFGQIDLQVQSCAGATCPQPASIRVPIISDDAKIQGSTRICPGSDAVYEIEPFGAGTYFTWTSSSNGVILEGQGSNKVKINWSANAGNSWVAVSYSNCYLGCDGKDTLWVQILPPFGINGPLEVCDGLSGAFVANQVVASGLPITCNWYLHTPSGAVVDIPSSSANAVMYFPNGPGNYQLIAIPVSSGVDKTCSDSASWKIRIAPKPPKLTGISGPAAFCPTSYLTYKAQGITGLNNVKWTIKNTASAPGSDFGESINTSFSSGTPRWVAAAQVTADALGCISDTVRLDVKEIPSIDFVGATSLCEGGIGAYISQAYSGVDYFWEIIPSDAGVIKSGQGSNNLDVFWIKPGVHTLRLTICGKVRDKTITVHAKPQPSVSAPDGVCRGQYGQVIAAGGYFSYNWLDTMGAVLITGGAVQSFKPGVYAVSVSDQYGCSGSNKFEIKEYPKPNITITTADPTGFCNNSRFVTMVALTNSDGDYSYNWYKDGVPIGDIDSIHTTNQYGFYSIQVKNQFGCIAKDGPIEIFDYCVGPPCYNPVHPPECPPGSISFTIDATPRCDSFGFHLITGPDYKAGTAFWAFGESGASLLGTSSSLDPSFMFPNAGKYLVIAYAQLVNGANCKVLDSVKVDAVANFNERMACPGDSSSFHDLSTFLPGITLTNLSWATQSSSVSSGTDPKFLYNQAGTYSVKLTIQTNNGCTATISRMVEVPPLPLVTIQPIKPNCVGNATQLFVSSTPDITKISWNCGDPASGGLNNLSGAEVYHKYSASTTYSAQVTLTNIAGCSASGAIPVTVVANTLGGAITPSGLSAICEGKNISLSAPGTGVGYQWSNGATSKTITVAEEGIFKVTLSDANGCTYVTPTKEVQVNPVPDGVIDALQYNEYDQVTGIVHQALEICFGENVHLIVSDNGTYGYQWSGSNIHDDELIFSDIRNNLLQQGTYTYTVTITNPATGCTSITPPFLVTVHETPNNLQVTTDEVCAFQNSTVSLVGAPHAMWQYIWNNGEIGPSFITQNAGSYFVRAVSEYGCVGQSPSVTIHPGPNVAAVPGGCHEHCDPDSVCVPLLPEIVSWQWYKDGQLLGGATEPGLFATQSGSYWVEMVDIYGCSAKSEPLVLTLYTGSGDVTGKVWSDVNMNGLIDAGDTLVGQMPIRLLRADTLLANTLSGNNGVFQFLDVLSVDYSVELDKNNLPPGWKIITNKAKVHLYGCDDQDAVDLLVQPVICTPISSVLNVKACEGSAYNYQNNLVPAGVSANFMYKTEFGCDSIVQLNVLSLPNANLNLPVWICNSEQYAYQNTLLLPGQVQEFHFTAFNGCDSLVKVHVNAYPEFADTLQVQACVGSVYTYAGVGILPGESRNFVLQTIHGCDSLLTVQVTPLLVQSSNLDVYVCPNDTFNYAGISLLPGSNKTFVSSASNGCDSVIQVRVHAYPAALHTTMVNLCSGGSYWYQNTAIPAGSSKDFILQTVHGCDSIVHIQVNSMPAPTYSLEVKICPGTMYDYNGTKLAIGSSQTFMLKTPQGCDSLVQVSVSGYPQEQSTKTVSICEGSTITYQGVTMQSGSSKTFTLQSVHGCDSLVTWIVNALPIIHEYRQVIVCPNETYSFEGVTLLPGQNQDFTLKTAAGCDSVITISVQAYATPQHQLKVYICPDQVYDYQGAQLKPGQIQTFTLKSYTGCDSLVTIQVLGIPVSADSTEVSVCPGSKYDFLGLSLPAGRYSFHYQGYMGCDSLIALEVKEHPGLVYDIQAQASCSNKATGLAVAYNLEGNSAPYAYSTDGNSYQTQPVFQNLDAGNYVLTIRDQFGCTYRKPFTVDAIEPLVVKLNDQILACDSSSVQLRPILQGNLDSMDIIWWNGDKTAFTQAQEVGTVWVAVRNICETVRANAEVKWADVDSAFSYAFFPNIIRPDAESVQNQTFKPLFAPGVIVQEYNLSVFDRWGNMVFQTKSADEGWNGNLKDRLMDPAVFVWLLKTDFWYCGRLIHWYKTGDVTVYR